MPGGACKIIIDAASLTGIADAAREDKKLMKFLEKSETAWELSAVCAKLGGEVNEFLRNED